MKRYTDHAANERTWLAWIRTAIAIMAFGFIIERFALFSAYLRASLDGLGGHALSPVANPLAVAMLALGMLIILLSTFRFHAHRRMIETENESTYPMNFTAIAMAVMLLLVGGILIFYMV
jgi:putative membrane protein